MTNSQPPVALRRELEVATALCQEAGVLALGYHGTDLDVEQKPGNEPVTVADREASAVIVAGLRDAFPADVVVSEEEAMPAGSVAGRRVWFVDPIDGTRGFIEGAPDFAVMVGLVVDGRPCLGVIYEPLPDRMLRGVLGQGAAMRTGDHWSPLQCSKLTIVAEARLLASRSHRSKKLEVVKQRLGIAHERNVGSVGVKIGFIARGEGDLYIHPSRGCKAWDTCAPQALLEAAGGRLTDLQGRPLHYDDADQRHNRGLIASNGVLHDAVVAGIQPIINELIPKEPTSTGQ